jgi:hypothetical protein
MRCATLAVCTALLALGCNRPAKDDVQAMLKPAGLAPLPASATNIFYHLWKGIFTAEVCARFELSSADMRAFISNSPSLNQVKPEMFDAERHYLPSKTGFVSNSKHRHFVRHPKWPVWFDPTLQGRGRVYDYTPHWGVILDEEKNIVWLNTGD